MSILPNSVIWQSVCRASRLLTVPVSFWLLISLRACKTLMSKNKLRSYQVKNLKDIFGHGIQEDQKQKIRALDFGIAPTQRPQALPTVPSMSSGTKVASGVAVKPTLSRTAP